MLPPAARQVALIALGIVVVLVARRALWPPSAPPGPEDRVGPCRAVHVVDGDTVDLRCDGRRERVRLLRVDTPERERPGYAEARRALAGWVRGVDLHLVFEERDRPLRGDHGRLLAYVFAGDANLNVELVRAGHSRFWTRYGEGRFADHFEAAEREARAAGRGLWTRQPAGSEAFW